MCILCERRQCLFSSSKVANTNSHSKPSSEVHNMMLSTVLNITSASNIVQLLKVQIRNVSLSHELDQVTASGAGQYFPLHLSIMSVIKASQQKTVVTLDFSLAKAKGQKLSELMYSDLEAWGYLGNKYVAKMTDMHGMLTSQVSPSQRSDFITICHFHIKHMTGEGRALHATDANFISDINIRSGLLIASRNYSPVYKARVSGWHLSAPLPSLQHWSDIAFLQWASVQQDEQGIRGLKYILRENAQNKDTFAVIRHVISGLPTMGNLLWPGVEFDAEPDKGMALLGTPSGAGVAWVLAQHRAQLGHKVVDKVVLFRHPVVDDCGHHDMTDNLLFCLRDVYVK